MMIAVYLGGLKVGTQICFITCDESLLPLYLHYGFRTYIAPAIIANNQKRHRLLLCVCDKTYLEKVRSPFLSHLPQELDDKGSYAKKIAKTGFVLDG